MWISNSATLCLVEKRIKRIGLHLGTIIADQKTYRVEIENTSRPARGLVCNFTGMGFTDLRAQGRGTKFLNDQGFDVIDFKCSRDSWHQDAPDEAISKAREISKNYQQVVTYGSSAGGFAAISFCDSLGANQVIALAPQHSIDKPFDKRWSAQASAIPAWKYPIQPNTCKGAKVYLVFDPKLPLDQKQIDMIESSLTPKSLFKVVLPFGGHQIAQFLSEIGQLKKTVESMLNGDDPIRVDYRCSDLKKSNSFLLSHGRHAYQVGRPRLAQNSLLRLLARGGAATHQANFIMSRIKEDEDMLEKAISHMSLACKLAPHKQEYQQRLDALIGKFRDSLLRKPV